MKNGVIVLCLVLMALLELAGGYILYMAFFEIEYEVNKYFSMLFTGIFLCVIAYLLNRCLLININIKELLK
jgi:hypothetical protein